MPKEEVPEGDLGKEGKLPAEVTAQKLPVASTVVPVPRPSWEDDPQYTGTTNPNLIRHYQQ